MGEDKNRRVRTVFCTWCPDPMNPSPEYHPGGGPHAPVPALGFGEQEIDVSEEYLKEYIARVLEDRRRANGVAGVDREDVYQELHVRQEKDDAAD